MNLAKYKEIIEVIGRLKTVYRHSWKTDNNRESVAEHSFRLALMALFSKELFPNCNLDKMIKICLLHDLGEAITGDIPSFLKKENDEKKENIELDNLMTFINDDEYFNIIKEWQEQKTIESKICMGLDKLEALISHNEADIKTWLPLEHELQLIYGDDETKDIAFLAELREIERNISLAKLNEENGKNK